MDFVRYLYALLMGFLSDVFMGEQARLAEELNARIRDAELRVSHLQAEADATILSRIRSFFPSLFGQDDGASRTATLASWALRGQASFAEKEAALEQLQDMAMSLEDRMEFERDCLHGVLMAAGLLVVLCALWRALRAFWKPAAHEPEDDTSRPDPERFRQRKPPGPESEEFGQRTHLPARIRREVRPEDDTSRPESKRFGQETTPPGPNPKRFGQRTTPPGPNPKRFGQRTTPPGPNPKRFGQRKPPGPNPKRFGQRTTPPGPNPKRFGQRTTPPGPNPKRFGQRTTPPGPNPKRFGQRTTPPGPNPKRFARRPHSRPGRGPWSIAERVALDLQGRVRSKAPQPSPAPRPAEVPQVAPWRTIALSLHFSARELCAALGPGLSHVRLVREWFPVRIRVPRRRGEPLVVQGPREATESAANFLWKFAAEAR
nr:proline-rich proteoglycan 2-like [Penaeus vannamei]